MTPPNTTPLNEELDKIVGHWVDGYKNGSQSKYYTVNNITENLLELIQTLEQKAELYGRLHETIEAFQAGAIDADAYSKRHATLTDEIAQLEKGSE